jgi:hypothetical protein
MFPKLISTKTHGVIDYLTAGALLALPRALGWGERPTRLLTGAAVGSLAYSLLTRYELGALKLLPMRVHLALDAMSGAALAASPLLLPDEDPEVKATLLALGLYELGVTALTKAEPAGEPGAGAMTRDTTKALSESAYGEVRRGS